MDVSAMVYKSSEKKYNICNFNISNTKQNDVFKNTPILFEYFYHLKGPRKDNINDYKKYFIR